VKGTYLIGNRSRPAAKEVFMPSMRAHVLVFLSVLLCGCPFLEEEGGDGVWHKCHPEHDEQFYEMQSGEPCDFSGGCGAIFDTNPEAVLIGREVLCVNGVLSVTESLRIDEPAPNEDVLWEDCSALKGGVSGDACDGSFTCFKPDPSGCLMMLGCGAPQEQELLVRYLLCDDESPEALAAEATHTSCDSAADARPLDACEGGFMCKSHQPYATVPPCEALGGYCMAEAVIDGIGLIWCDQDTLHVFFADHYVGTAVLNWIDW
jgi:hypothetical protein